MTVTIDAARLIARLKELGATGRDETGRLCRVAATDADRQGRDLLCNWLSQAGLRIEIDRIGNIHGIWEPEGAEGDPVIIGSHIDTVIDAGIYDGCYGVLAGLAVIEAMQLAGDCRSFRLDVFARIEEEMRRIARGIAEGHGVTVNVDYTREFVPTINDAALAEDMMAAAEPVSAQVAVRAEPMTASEDFARFQLHVPGCFAFIGNGEDCPPLHNPGYDFNDDALIHGMQIHVATVRRSLALSRTA